MRKKRIKAGDRVYLVTDFQKKDPGNVMGRRPNGGIQYICRVHFQSNLQRDVDEDLLICDKDPLLQKLLSTCLWAKRKGYQELLIIIRSDNKVFKKCIDGRTDTYSIWKKCEDYSDGKHTYRIMTSIPLKMVL